MKKAVVSAFSAFFLALALTATAFAQELVVGGQVVGIQISTEGVLVAKIASVETAEGSRSPGTEAGLQEGDFIVRIDGAKVVGAAELISAVTAQEGKPVQLTVLRKDKPMKISITPALSRENQWMLGMWLRDGISGIGTVTFFDPATGIYGALGHSVSDSDTGLVVPLSNGSITDADVVGIKKGEAGTPGELNGCADIGKVLGTIEKNTGHGIYGRANSSLGSKIVETGNICTGKATIVSTINGGAPAEYEVEISRIYSDADGKHVMLTVTDPALCAQTGGIVQGMSGSPIMQNGKLVGAVTHVFVNDPTRGYGICIQDMLAAAEICEDAA